LELENMRIHFHNVLIQLSTHGFGLFADRPLSQSSVREPLGKIQPDGNHPVSVGRQSSFAGTFHGNGDPLTLADEATSNLFYYLFEDYVAAGPFTMAKQVLAEMVSCLTKDRFVVLGSLTDHVYSLTRFSWVLYVEGRRKFNIADAGWPLWQDRRYATKKSDIVRRLHNLNKDLREMRHLFEGYRNLIDKVLNATRGHPNISLHGNVNTVEPDASIDKVLDGTLDLHRPVILTQLAANRFERLRDRLQWLLLDTITGHLEELHALLNTVR
jgi:hypothetical protein